MTAPIFPPVFIAIILTALVFEPAAHAGRPLAIDDAGTVAAGDCEVEVGFYFERDSSLRHYELPVAVTFGLPAQTELGVAAGWQWEQRRTPTGRETENDVTDVVIAGKWNPLSEEGFWASHALAAAVKIPAADEEKGFGSGKVDYDVTYIATKSLLLHLCVDANGGYTWVGGDDDTVHYGLALRWQATDNIELVGEVTAETVLASGNETAVAVNAGARWLLMDACILDAAVGAGLNRHAPDWTATVGATWTFGFSSENR